MTKYLHCKQQVMPYMLEYINSYVSGLELKLVVECDADWDNLKISDNDVHVFVQTIPENILISIVNAFISLIRNKSREKNIKHIWR